MVVIRTDLTNLSEVTRSVHLLKIEGYYGYKVKHSQYQASRCEVDGYEWEIRFYPRSDITLEFVFLSQPRGNKVTVSLGARLVDPSGAVEPSAEKTLPSKEFHGPSDSSGLISIMPRSGACSSGYIKNESSMTVECTLAVSKDQESIPMPSSNMHQHMAALLKSKDSSADVAFTVSGERFDAHKIVLAARSPVFMAEFFGEMAERTAARVEIEEMEAAVFRAMLHFIYTDTVPELDEKQESAAAMAQHLLVAADRYGLDRLRVMCERRIALGLNAGTVAAALALAERHGCSQLKAKCVEFIVGGSDKNLDAVVETQGFKRLEWSNPSVLTHLLKAAHKRIKK